MKYYSDYSDSIRGYSRSLVSYIDIIWRRGSLAILELSGVGLLFRATLASEFIVAPAVVGAILLALGVILECVILRITINASMLMRENESLRADLRQVLDERPRGFAVQRPSPQRDPDLDPGA